MEQVAARREIVWAARLRAVCWSFLFWTATGGVFALSRLGSGQNTWNVVLPALIQWWMWGLLAPLIVAVDRRLPFHGSFSFVHLLVHLVLGPLWVLLYSIFSESICYALGLQQWGNLFATYRQGLFWTMLIYLLIVGVSEADLFRKRQMFAEVRAERLSKNLSEARLLALRMQLDPHFLFNALNTISAEVSGNPKLARRMIEHLGDLLRASLESKERQEVTLGEEMDLLSHYIALQKARFGESLQIVLAVPTALRSRLVPALVLQPLLENAIRHGISPRSAGGTVAIGAKVVADNLLLTVTDDGVGLPPGWTLEDRAGLGLTLTSERIAVLCPDTLARLTIGPREHSGTAVEVLLPCSDEPRQERP
jgi:two-component system LytT family sensor kinase